MTGPRHTVVGTAAIELGNLNAMRVIGNPGDKGQVEALNHRRQAAVVTVMNGRVKAAIRNS